MYEATNPYYSVLFKNQLAPFKAVQYFSLRKDSGPIVLKYIHPSSTYLAYIYTIYFLVYLYSGTWHL